MSMDLNLSEGLSLDSIESLARKLKHYWSNIYVISPVELASFVKIKSNFLRQGIVLEESVLNSSVSSITNWLRSQLRVSSSLSFESGSNVPNDSNLNELLNVDVGSIESERQEIRKQLFKEEIKVRIKQSVKNFSIQCNKKMSVWDIRIPASWDAQIEQSFLLNLYDKTFHNRDRSSSQSINSENKQQETGSITSTPKEATLVNDSIDKQVSDIIDRYDDFSLMRADLDQMLLDNEDLTTLELGEDIFGDNLPLSSIMILRVLSDRVRSGSMSLEAAIDKMGSRRKRLIKRLKQFISVAD